MDNLSSNISVMDFPVQNDSVWFRLNNCIVSERVVLSKTVVLKMTKRVLLLIIAPYFNLCISLETSCYLMLFSPSHLKAVYFSHVCPGAPGASWGLYLQNIATEPLQFQRHAGVPGQIKMFLTVWHVWSWWKFITSLHQGCFCLKHRRKVSAKKFI